MREGPSGSSLAGRTIAVPEMRELDVLAGLLERRGARVRRCPLVAIHDAPDPHPVLAWIERACAGELNELVLSTGEGLRRLMGCLERHRPELRPGFLAALARVRTITRGPKPGRALRELGLKADLPARVPTTAGVIEVLAGLDLAGHRVGVQLYGTEPNRPLIEFLERAGAEPRPVAPYVYAGAAEDGAVRDLLAAMTAGEIDAIAFTSRPQVQRLFAAAPADAVRAALGGTLVAAVGPVVAQALSAHGVTARAVPAQSYFLKPLVRALESALER